MKYNDRNQKYYRQTRQSNIRFKELLAQIRYRKHWKDM